MSFQQFFVTEGNWECEVNIENNTAKCKKRFNLLDYVENTSEDSQENKAAIWISKDIKLLLVDYRTKLTEWRPYTQEVRPVMKRIDNEITMSYKLSAVDNEYQYTIIDNKLQNERVFQNELSLWLQTTILLYLRTRNIVIYELQKAKLDMKNVSNGTARMFELDKLITSLTNELNVEYATLVSDVNPVGEQLLRTREIVNYELQKAKLDREYESRGMKGAWMTARMFELDKLITSLTKEQKDLDSVPWFIKR